MVGLLLADTLVVRSLWGPLSGSWGLAGPFPGVTDLLRHQLEHDGITLAFLALGVIGGGWVWRQPGEE